MQLILIVEHTMFPIPDNIKILQEFGKETVVGEKGNMLATGDSMFLEASPEDFKTWLRPFGTIWKSNNPMAGQWEAVHIAD